jgi:hypothetical protein
VRVPSILAPRTSRMPCAASGSSNPVIGSLSRQLAERREALVDGGRGERTRLEVGAVGPVLRPG